VLRLKPDHVQAHNNMGIALANSGRLPEAVDFFRQTLTLKPDFTEVYLNLASAYAGMRQSSEAIASAQQALELARSQRQTVLAKQIEDWLNAYQGPEARVQGPEK
jgi:tetratricopeptide (TPR) repeat protein